jgi:subtilisin-like proprotein convertase family protein
MKISTLPVLGSFLLAGNLAMAAKPKTANPVKINPALIDEAPYRFNGVVLTENARGSGFCAWHPKTFFSAAHVVFGDTAWTPPPYWVPAQNSAQVDADDAILSRGYYRWIEYGDLAVNPGSDTAFRRDVMLGFAFKKLIAGTPAKINRNGEEDLRKKIPTMITGYPAKNAYFEESISGYFLHQTGPTITPYQTYEGKALTSTLVTTGPGNSGGPIWTKNSKKEWIAAGVLTGGLPSEAVIYAFSKDIDSFTRAVAPVIRKNKGTPIAANGVTASSFFFAHNEDTRIPDGVQKWTSFRFGVDKFGSGATVTKVKLSLEINTGHRGDLQVILEGPGGYQALVHNENAAGKNNLIFRDRDFTASFAEIEADGYWYLRVQDRIAGDKAMLKSAVLEISTDGADTTVPNP